MTNSWAASAGSSGTPSVSSRPHMPVPAMIAATARETRPAKRVIKSSYFAVSAVRLSSTLPRRRVSRFTLYKSQIRSNVSISGKLRPPSHLLTDWRDTSNCSASCSWVTPAWARRNCRFSENDIRGTPP